jgi:hypothetical protein
VYVLGGTWNLDWKGERFVRQTDRQKEWDPKENKENEREKER